MENPSLTFIGMMFLLTLALTAIIAEFTGLTDAFINSL